MLGALAEALEGLDLKSTIVNDSMTPPPTDVTQLLVAWGNGDQAARDELMPLVYAELHRLAHRHIKKERPGHTLQTSALVNEAFVRLVDQRDVHWQSRAHFFGIAAQMMSSTLPMDISLVH